MLPEIVAVAELVLFCTAVAYAYYLLPLWALAIVAPSVAFVSVLPRGRHRGGARRIC